MKAIADASSLIVLARLDALWLLNRVYGAVAIIPDVALETVERGKAKGYPDALKIEAALETGELVVITPTRSEQGIALVFRQRAAALSRTDCLVLACARERELTLVMEDQRAKNLAEAQAIYTVTIRALPLQGYIGGRLSYKECDSLLVEIGQAMHTDPAILHTLRAAAQEIQRLRARL